MKSDYVFLCGVMWCKLGQRDAGKELLRASDSGDPDCKSTGSGDVCERSAPLERVDKTPFAALDDQRRSMWMSSCSLCTWLVLLTHSAYF